MQIPRTKTILLIIVVLILPLAAFTFGGIYGAGRASYAGHTATLVWLTGIHKALESGNVERAREITDDAVDAHIGVLNTIETTPSSPVLYALLWSRGVDHLMTQHTLDNTQRYFSHYPDQLRPETRQFLAQHATP